MNEQNSSYILRLTGETARWFYEMAKTPKSSTSKTEDILMENVTQGREIEIDDILAARLARLRKKQQMMREQNNTEKLNMNVTITMKKEDYIHPSRIIGNQSIEVGENKLASNEFNQVKFDCIGAA